MEAWIREKSARGEWPQPFTYLFTDFIPMLLARGLSMEAVERILVDNPRRFFSGEAPARLSEGAEA